LRQQDEVALARAHLERARTALGEGDETAAVLWCNLCAELAVAHVAAVQGIDTRRDHFRRASLARRMYEVGAVPEDLGDLMIRLNNERKHGVYEGRAPDLRGRTWEQVFDSLERLVEAAAEAKAPDD
jgi:HEPN domain-containing protein